MTESEQLRLPVRWTVLGAVIAVMVVMLVLAGLVNQRRRASQLRAMEAIDCAAVYSSEVVEKLKTLQSKRRLTEKYARSVAKEVQALYRRGRRVEVLYERNGKVWAVSPWNGPRPDGDQELAPEWGEWPALMDEGFCEGESRDQAFVVGRTVMLDSQQHVVVITYQSMGT